MVELGVTIHQFSWEACHRLVKNYDNHSNHFHGHSYVAKIVIHKDQEKLVDVPLEYPIASAQFKIASDTWLEENWHHAALLAPEDKQSQRFWEESGQRMYLCTGSPTVTVLARELFEKAVELADRLPVKVVEVSIHAANYHGTWSADMKEFSSSSAK